jgi:hypothetical protein
MSHLTQQRGLQIAYIAGCRKQNAYLWILLYDEITYIVYGK